MSRGVAVTGIMPTYNGAPYLGAAIQSIIDQTFTDWELIVVDDGSTDETPDVLARIVDPRVKVHRFSTNRGRSAARNFALDRSTGRYIAPCDSDDVSLPARFARLAAVLDAHPSLDVVGCQAKYFSEFEPPRVRVLYPTDPDAIRRRFARGRQACLFGAALIRSSCFERFGNFNEEMKLAMDLEFFLRIYPSCSFANLPDFLYLYRHPIQGISWTKWLNTVSYARYAVVAAQAAHRDQPAEPYRKFRRSNEIRLKLYTVDLLRYFYYIARSYLRIPHALR